jgi:hypothetical protein
MIGDAAEHIGEPSLRIDVVQLGGLDQRVHRGSPFPSPIGAGETRAARGQFRPS